DLAGIRLYESEVRIEPRFQADVLADDPAEHLKHLAQDAVQIENSRPDYLFAAERQKLVGQPADATRCAVNLFRGVPQRILGTQAVQQKLAVSGDDGQQIVEVVGHAASKPSERLHSERL